MAKLIKRSRVQIFCDEPSLAKQEFRDECNINNIMAKYKHTGVIDHVSTFNGDYGDFFDIQDYQSSLNQVIEANNMFMSLPAHVRNRFENDPAQFLNFVSDESNVEEMRNLGLLPLTQPELILTENVTDLPPDKSV